MRKYFYFLLLISLCCSPLISAVQPKKTTDPIVLQVVEVPIVVNGKPSHVYRFRQPDGTIGLTAKKGEDLHVVVENKTNAPTSVHWHGIILPNKEDGVPYVTQEPIMPGEKFLYHFPLVQSGTYWIHSHFRLQEQKLLAAPFIIYDPKEKLSDQEVVMFLEDFSFQNPKLIYKKLRCQNLSNNKQDMSSMKMNDNKSMQMGAMDLNDVQYDAFLANERDLTNPRIYRVKPNTVVRLRAINGSASSNFYINTGSLQPKVIAVDGERIKSLIINPFQLGIGQRVDMLLKIPEGEASYPILAQGEGLTMQTGIILATPNAKIPSLPNHATTATKGFDYQHESSLRALESLANKKPDKSITLDLQGDMKNYIWKINNAVWPYIKPLMIKEGERIEFVFNNTTSMSHPMHFHGHVFQVSEINNQPLLGAKRDTVLVLPKSTVKVQFDATNAGVWMMHCHNLYHAAAGMMTKLIYDGYKPPVFTLQEQASMSGSLLFNNPKQCSQNNSSSVSN